MVGFEYPCPVTASLGTKTLDFRGFDSSVILMLRGGLPRPIGDFPESLSQAISAGIVLLGRLGVSIATVNHIFFSNRV